MRAFSSTPHHLPICNQHDCHVIVDDACLPAAAHLVGPDAHAVLAPVVQRAGAELVECAATGVQYRPGSDLVVRYRCSVRRNDRIASDTLLAATTTNGALPGTVPVEAVAADGSNLRVGVWRWPFDPVLTDLSTMVTPSLAEAPLRTLLGGLPELEVVAYRPAERAVVRARGPEREVYVKVVPPSTTTALVDRHEHLAAGGVPVPSVLEAGDGWIALEALHGTTLRDRLKSGDRALPTGDQYRALLEALAHVTIPGAAAVRSRINDARHHAAMLATVVPEKTPQLDDIVDRLATECAPTGDATVHGDLHEAQLIVDDNEVTGLIDIDDAGQGNPLDDIGTFLAHLRFRALTSDEAWIDSYYHEVRASVAGEHEPATIDLRIAAVLIGLATGPFRVQQPGWRGTTTAVLALAEAHLDAMASTTAG